MKLTRIVVYIVLYVVSFNVLFWGGFITFGIIRYIAREIVRIQDFMARGTYSAIEALMVIAIYGIAIFGSIFVARWLYRALSKFRSKPEVEIT